MHANGRACSRLGSVIAVDGPAIVRCWARLDGRIEDRGELDVVRAQRGDSGVTGGGGWPARGRDQARSSDRLADERRATRGTPRRSMLGRLRTDRGAGSCCPAPRMSTGRHRRRTSWRSPRAHSTRTASW